jgi:hypothetical protein
MNNLTNKTLGTITHVADKLLSQILLEDNAAAFCWRTCFSCIRRKKLCKERCCGWLGCKTSSFYINC